MFWSALVVMCLVAIAFAVWPFVQQRPRSGGVLAVIVIVGVAGLSAGVYSFTGRPGVPSGARNPESPATAPDLAAMIESLAERLEREPDDLEGWKMLARSNAALGNTAEAIAAWEQAVEVSSARDAGALIGLGEAVMAEADRTVTPRAASLFENALALEPNNSAALFWGGIAAFNRGDPVVAADRWELLLGTNPPPELRPIIEERVAVWRGETPPAPPAAPAGPAAGPDEGNSDRIVAATLSIDDAAAATLPGEAIVFVIARDPGQPSPPIAVTRRRLSELPLTVELDNGDSMIAGRELASFAEFELVARVSLSGSPAAQPGDWFGSAIVRPAEGDEIDLAISQRVE